MDVRARRAVAGRACVPPEETDPRDGEPMIGVGRKVSVVGFDRGGTVQVVSVERDYHNRSLDLKG